MYRLITGYRMGGANYDVVNHKQISYITLIGVHSTMHLMHPNQTVIYMYLVYMCMCAYVNVYMCMAFLWFTH